MKRIPVHCCCDPRIVLGTLDVPGEYCHPHARFRVVMQEPVSWVGAEYRPPSKPWKEGEQYIVIAVETLWLETNGRAQAILAVKSNDMPIETFRRIPGFVENQHRRINLEK